MYNKSTNGKGRPGYLRGAIFNGQAVVGCPLCGAPLLARNTRRGRPYFKCADCGLITFINSPMGIKRLRAAIERGGVHSEEILQ